MSAAERRARLGRRHHLAVEARARRPADVAASLVGIHSTDPASVFLGTAARTVEPDLRAVESALYDERSLIRMLGMRRTMFVVPRDLVPVVQAGATAAVAAKERERLLSFVRRSSVRGSAERWLASLEADTVAAIAARGTAATAELTRDVPGLSQQLIVGDGKWQAVVSASTRVLLLLAADGRIVRARPRGTWISSQYRWALLDEWLGGALPSMSQADARTELARRWLASFGPATVTDLKWWTGWTVTEARAALARAGAEDVDLDGTPGVVLANDTGPTEPPEPWVALLPALDSTPMGWTARDWYLGGHRDALFDRSGNVGPTVWSDGRVVGGWAQRKDGTVTVRLLEDVGAAAASAIDDAAARAEAVLDGVVVTPRFRTPLERELSSAGKV